MTNAQSIPDDQIRSAFKRWLNLEEEKARISDDLKEFFAEQKSLGHDTKAMRAAFRLKVKMDEANPEDAEHEALVDTYLSALEVPSRATRAYARENIEEFDPLTGEVFDGEANAKLIATVAAGVQTEVGRKALVAALDIMIEREETTVGGDESGTASEFDRPATPAASGGRPSEPSSVAGGAKMDDRCIDDPGRLGDAPILTSAKTEQATNPIPADVPAFLTAQLNERCLKQGNCRYDRHPQKITCSECGLAWAKKKREAA